MTRLYLLLLMTATCTPFAATAQTIAIKTVPVATGDQFLLFPSQRLGMGGVTIALDDPLADPFSNPARGAFLEGTHFISSPLFYSISMNDNFNGGGHARTVPLGMLSRNGNAFGGGLVAWQQLSVERAVNRFFPGDSRVDVGFAPRLKSEALDNIYAFVTGGLKSEDDRVSVGLSLTGAHLNGVEGVRLLYRQGANVDQDGSSFEVRGGMTAELNSSSRFDLVVSHHRYHMEQRIDNSRLEEDQTNGVGVLLGYTQQMEDGWRIGGEAVGNWQWHPKIPNYDIMQIPRDPGNSSAYNFGVGIARQHDDMTIGLDVIYEPIRSHTWANALSNITVTDSFSGQSHVIRAGEKTVENFFDFNNRIIRFGVNQTGETIDLQVGVDVHTIRYHLDQTNYEFQFARSQDERWSEWTLSTGLALKFSALEIRYLGRLTLGTGQPGVNSPWGWGWGCTNCRADFAAAESNFLVAPNGELTLQEAKVFTSQFAIRVPIGSE